MGWTLFFMLVVLKIPMIFAGYLIWYAIKEQPDPAEEPDTDNGPRRRMPPFPRRPRRGPEGGGSDCQPVPCPQETSSPAPAMVPAARSRNQY